MDKRIFVALIALLITLPVQADDDAVRAAVEKLLPDRTQMQIGTSPMAGISEVAVGTEVFYVSSDGAFVLGGPMIATADGRNLTEARVSVSRQDILSSASGMRRFHYPAEEIRHRITVVTDIDCPYCRRMHKDLPTYQAAGIDVTYVMLPRAGKGSNSYRKTVNAACASDPEEAITAAMNGETPGTVTCDHPIDQHMALARELGVTSTPTIVLADGRVVLGAKKPAELLSLINAE